MTEEWLAVLQAKRDEFYRIADEARDRHEWETQGHYFSMGMGVTAAIAAILNADVAAQKLEHKRVSTS